MVKLLIDLPAINPVAFQLGALSIHWYGIMYLIGFCIVYWALLKSPLKLTKETVSDYIFWAALGVIIGGRLGYVVFYNLFYYLENPLHILTVWEGGMSFHGGILGVIIATSFFCYLKSIKFWAITDYIVIFIPFTLALGRIGNFINGELYGRISNLPWAMHFPTAPGYRHPSQLYESILHILFGLILLQNKSLYKYRSLLSGIFLLGYAVIRIVIELFREPDVQIGLIGQYFTLGQLLSVPLLIAGLYLTTRTAHPVDETH